MMARETAEAAAQALWQAMVELAEAGNDLVVQSQKEGLAQHAVQIASAASDLAFLARAASLLAMHSRT